MKRTGKDIFSVDGMGDELPVHLVCGAPNCIHVVAGARFLPVSTLEGHFLNYHIRQLMIETLNRTEKHLAMLESQRKAEMASKGDPAVA